MSFILDALKKSETDRQRQSSPALFEVKVAAPRRRFPLWALGLGVLLGVNVLVLLWVLLRDPQAPAATTAAAGATPPASASPGASPGQVTVPATVTFQVNVPSSSVSGAPPVEPGVVASSVAPPLAEEPLLSGQETAVPPNYDTRDYQPAITVEEANATAAARRAGALPSRDELLAKGGQLPDMRLDLHVYDPDPAKRFVFINMRKLREGESLPDGVRVDEIMPTGARLTYQGSQFVLGGN
jgi:general secretion pathway protein B